ncbi:hypothetical protein RRF57_006564 [Xylaria bambusicola]|uniref:Uncharacterized protein n=1 Tax=Xylaria bambusicola TaxID=326684 RepID=A0AAN7UP15_9PEZI
MTNPGRVGFVHSTTRPILGHSWHSWPASNDVRGTPEPSKPLREVLSTLLMHHGRDGRIKEEHPYLYWGLTPPYAYAEFEKGGVTSDRGNVFACRFSISPKLAAYIDQPYLYLPTR